MVALVSLLCPACGGKIKVQQNVTSISCQYCGTEHMVKHEANGVIQLEAYARCPICGRNDKAEKVTAVIASQTHEITGTEQRTEEIVNAQGQKQKLVVDVPYTRKQVSVLGQRLVAPNPPDRSLFPPFPEYPRSASKSRGMGLTVTGVLIILVSLCGGLSGLLTLFPSARLYFGGPIPEDLLVGSVTVAGAAIGGLIGLLLLSLGVVLLIRAKRLNPAIVQAYNEKVSAVRQEHERIQKRYTDALTRWLNLYYCGRDDCVFLPGENSSAAVTELAKYLYDTTQHNPSG